MPVALEPVQREFAQYWTVASSLDEAAALIDESGADVGLLYDSWHLWREPRSRSSATATESAASTSPTGAEPTRNTNDRVLPGDGAVDFAPIFDALRWDGFYDLEIFSDPELPGSLWQDDPRALAARGSRR